ncbi:glycosyltransferase family 4 protein [Aliiglaciecola sp. LCG003]|uniref:glycosyltransferase family 4 protein n=1 Tax=Aliiglaciecola sp. LCG003 TaxID=3053655 RepID=UPI0025743CE1|nr:glycosyltransferase family 4 protein [Aliiglaciecola sp. LCG003]WJG10404.1 glycosyltransferase family 4 protein [Aliiglaciecola sp. LCG003]
MKILRIYPFLPPNPGGMEKHILRLSEEQIKQGHDVTLAFSDGLAVSSHDIKLKFSFSLRKVRPQSLRDLIFYLRLSQKIRKNKLTYDVIHIHGAWSAFFFAKLIKRVSKARVVMGSIHGQIPKSYLSRLIYKFVSSSIDVVYCTGLEDVNFLKKNIVSKSYWRTSGVDESFYIVDKLNSQQKEIDVISVGSFVEVKNHKLIVDIADKLPHLKFCLVGDGPLFDKIKDLLAERNILNVSLMGNLDYAQVANLMKSSSIFLMTSLSEGTPTSMLEAMASGNVVITSNSNDFSSIFANEKEGFVLKTFETSKYVNLINMLLENNEMMKEISDAARANSQLFSWKNVASQITSWMKDEL